MIICLRECLRKAQVAAHKSMKKAFHKVHPEFQKLRDLYLRTLCREKMSQTHETTSKIT